MQNATKVLTRQEVLNLFSITAPTLRAWQKKGLIKGIKMSHKVYFSENEINQLFNSKNNLSHGK